MWRYQQFKESDDYFFKKQILVAQNGEQNNKEMINKTKE